MAIELAGMTGTTAWLPELLLLLRRARLPAALAVAWPDRLVVRLALPDGHLEVSAIDRERASHAYAETGRFRVSYEGPARLEPPVRRQLDLLVALLARAERAIRLEPGRYAAAGRLDGDPVREAPRLFPFVSLERAEIDGRMHAEALVRVTYRCNQACPFCSAPEPVEQPDRQSVGNAVRLLAAAVPDLTVTLTGGEPTLRSDLPGLLADALALSSVVRLQLQTNAVLLAGRDPSELLPADPRLVAFVSLHALDPEAYDRITGSRGQLPRAIDGLRRLVVSGRETIVNLVVNRHNVGALESFLAGLRRHFPAGGPEPRIHFSVMMCPPHRSGLDEMLVRYTEAAPALERAYEAGLALGLPVDPLLSSTHAAIPLCLLARAYRTGRPHLPEIAPGECGYETYDGRWVKADRCRGCRYDPHCTGLPVAYGLRFGLDEIAPPDD